MSARKVSEKVHSLADMNIGKKGVTEAVLAELAKRLDAQGVVKVRVNRNLAKKRAEVEMIAMEVAGRVGAKVVDVRGRTMVLVKGGRRTF